MREISKTLATFAILSLFVLGFAACGDDGSDETNSTTGVGAASAEPEPARGGEASIEDFGSEASGGERTAIEGAFHGYLNAVAAEDYGAACSHLAAGAQQSLEQYAPEKLKAQGCEGILPTLLASTAAVIAREQADGEITRVRVDGDQAFVVFRAPGAELFQMTMVSEGGDWKAATVAAAVLVPDL